MKCKTAEHQMALAVGEDLSSVESQELQGHLQDCLKCQKTWEQQQHGFAILQHSRTQGVQRKSDSVWPVLSNRLRERAAVSPRGEFNGWFAGLAVTAACVLVFVFSQDGSVPIASQTRPGILSGGTMISSPSEWQTKTPQRPQQDELRTKAPYNAAPRP